MTVPKGPKHIKRQMTYGEKAVERSGIDWYKSHPESKYFPDFPIDAEALNQVYPAIYERCLMYQLHFLFEQPWLYNLSIVREFYANMSKEACTRQVKVQGVTIDFSPLIINEIIGTPSEITDTFDALVQHPPYQAIRHTLSGPQSIARWDKHAYKGFH